MLTTIPMRASYRSLSRVSPALRESSFPLSNLWCAEVERRNGCHKLKPQCLERSKMVGFCAFVTPALLFHCSPKHSFQGLRVVFNSTVTVACSKHSMLPLYRQLQHSLFLLLRQLFGKRVCMELLLLQPEETSLPCVTKLRHRPTACRMWLVCPFRPQTLGCSEHWYVLRSLFSSPRLIHALSVQFASLVTELVYQRDVVSTLQEKGALSPMEFVWQSQLRLEMHPSPSRTAADAHPVVAKCCDAVLPYGYEYVGNRPRLVVTPLTTRCRISLTQVRCAHAARTRGCTCVFLCRRMTTGTCSGPAIVSWWGTGWTSGHRKDRNHQRPWAYAGTTGVCVQLQRTNEQ